MAPKENPAFQNVAQALRQMSDEEKSIWLRKASSALRRDADELRAYTGSIREFVRKAERQLAQMDQASRATQQKIVQEQRRLDGIERSINTVRRRLASSDPEEAKGEKQ